jgi:copper oxidase (laccase) domain-containing protein
MRRTHDGDLVAAVGPCIGCEAFEVGEEVLHAFAGRFGAKDVLRRREDGKGHVDLRRAVRIQLVELGVTRVDETDRCTFTHREEFYSHRREDGVTGRMAALIGARGKETEGP